MDVQQAAQALLDALFANVPPDHDDIDIGALDDRLVSAVGSGADYGMGLSYEDVVTVTRAFLRDLAQRP